MTSSPLKWLNLNNNWRGWELGDQKYTDDHHQLRNFYLQPVVGVLTSQSSVFSRTQTIFCVTFNLLFILGSCEVTGIYVLRASSPAINNVEIFFLLSSLPTLTRATCYPDHQAYSHHCFELGRHKLFLLPLIFRINATLKSFFPQNEISSRTFA